MVGVEAYQIEVSQDDHTEAGKMRRSNERRAQHFRELRAKAEADIGPAICREVAREPKGIGGSVISSALLQEENLDQNSDDEIAADYSAASFSSSSESSKLEETSVAESLPNSDGEHSDDESSKFEETAVAESHTRKPQKERKSLASSSKFEETAVAESFKDIVKKPQSRKDPGRYKSMQTKLNPADAEEESSSAVDPKGTKHKTAGAEDAPRKKMRREEE